MKVIVASKNPVKVAAAREAFATQFPDTAIELDSVRAASGVSAQPSSDAETRRGARQRASHAQRLRPDGDFWVGLEGGIDLLGEQLVAFAWMAIRGPIGDISEARSATLPLPPLVRALMDQGMELGDANDRVFATLNSKQRGGAYGLLTKGLYTRESIYAQTLIIALIPFVNLLFPQAGAKR